MKLGDLVLTQGSSSSSSSSTTDLNFKGIFSGYFNCDIDIECHDVIETTDGNYVIVGTDYTFGIIIKCNESEVLWVKTVRIPEWNQGDDYGYLQRIIELDGYYYVQGSAYNYWSGPVSNTVIKFDQDGNIIWSKRLYNGWADDFCGGIIECHDPNYLIAFTSWYDGQNDLNWHYSPVLYKIRKSDGELMWCHGFKTDGAAHFLTLDKTNDGGYITAFGNFEYITYLPSVNYNVNIVKVDANGNKVWAKKYYRSGGYFSDTPDTIKLTPDGGFIVAIDGVETANYLLPGAWVSPVNELDVLIMKLNSTGDIQWVTRFHNCSIGDGYYDGIRGNIEVLNDGYVFTCDSRSEDAMLIKIDLNGTYVWGKTLDVQPEDGVVDSLYDPRVKVVSDGILVLGMSYAVSYTFALAKLDFNGEANDCPFIKDGVSTYSEDFTSSIISTNNYMYIKDFPLPFNDAGLLTFTHDFNHHVICDRTYHLNDSPTLCNEYFSYPDGTQTFDILQWISGTGTRPYTRAHQLYITQPIGNVGTIASNKFATNYAFNSMACGIEMKVQLKDSYGDGYGGSVGLAFGVNLDFSITFHYPGGGGNVYLTAHSNTVDETWLISPLEHVTQLTLSLLRDIDGNVTVSATSSIFWRAWGGTGGAALNLGNQITPLRPVVVTSIGDRSEFWVDDLVSNYYCSENEIIPA
jgi:hypothetical protein